MTFQSIVNIDVYLCAQFNFALKSDQLGCEDTVFYVFILTFNVPRTALNLVQNKCLNIINNKSFDKIIKDKR